MTDAEGHATHYTLDDFTRPVRTTNAKSETTKMTWDADNNVSVFEEANGAKTAYCFDPKTGYPLWQRDAESNKAGLPAQSECAVGQKPTNGVVYEYQTRGDGYAADMFRKTSAEGRAWKYGYDCFGNLKTVTDPKGTATWTAGQCAPTTSGYTTSYTYDSYGQPTRTTDANNNATANSDFDPNGYPRTVTDPYLKAATFVYDDRGQVSSVTDALGKTSTQTYDTFKRPLVSKVPKVQAAGTSSPRRRRSTTPTTTSPRPSRRPVPCPRRSTTRPTRSPRPPLRTTTTPDARAPTPTTRSATSERRPSRRARLPPTPPTTSPPPITTRSTSPCPSWTPGAASSPTSTTTSATR